MINSVQSSDLGLTQALTSGVSDTSSEAVAGLTENFEQVLGKTQDQKAIAELAMPKGGSAKSAFVTPQAIEKVKAVKDKKAEEDAAAMQAASQLLVGVAQPKIETPTPKASAIPPKGLLQSLGGKPETVAKTKVEVPGIKGTNEKAPELKQDVKAVVNNQQSAFSQSLGMLGPQAPVAQASVISNRELSTQLKAQQLKSNEPLVKAAPQPQGQPKTSGIAVSDQAQAQVQAPMLTVLQPIIVPMPVLAPVPVMIESVSAEDFIANRQNPIIGALASEGQLQNMILDAVKNGDWSEEQSAFEDSNVGSDILGTRMDVLMPHVAAKEMQVSSDSNMNTSTFSSSEMAMNAQLNSDRVAIANPYALAARINSMAANGGGSIRMKVMPEQLGEVTISVESNRGKLDVKLEADSKAARDILSQGLAELKTALAASRYEVGEIQVSGVKENIFAQSNWNSTASSNDMLGLRSLDLGQSFMNMSEQSQSGWKDQPRHQQSSNSAWDRYFDQQEGSFGQSGGRQQSAYRRYRDAGLLG
jgi:hypothetical protein